MNEPAAKPGPPVPPHSPLPGYYGPDGERTGYVNRLFDEAAPHYEWINRMMSLGSGEAYRRMALERAGLRPGMQLLDIATGTGLVLRPASRIVGARGRVVGLDPSAGMLGESRAIEARPLVQARGETLPFPSQSFDFVSLGYGLRHMADLRSLFDECFRVLRRTGRLLVLEFARPRSGVTLSLSRFYLKRVVPFVTRLGTSSPAAEQVMRYCWDTVNERVPTELVIDAMRQAGFAGAARRRVFGIFVEFSGERAAE